MPIAMKHLEEKFKSKYITSLLARWTDQMYYKIEVLECDIEARRCLSKFEDGIQKWMGADELHAQLNHKYLASTDAIICCACDKEVSERPNEIVLCDTCQQGYHIDCHDPPINRILYKLDYDDVETEWICSTCQDIISKNPRKPTPKKVELKRESKRELKKDLKREFKKEVKKETKSSLKVKLEVKQQVVEESIVSDESTGNVEMMSPEMVKIAKLVANSEISEEKVLTTDFVALITQV